MITVSYSSAAAASSSSSSSAGDYLSLQQSH
jgi:hypothetical protein